MRWGIAIFLHFTFTLVDATKWQIGSIVRIKPIQSLNPTESLVKFVLPPGNSGNGAAETHPGIIVGSPIDGNIWLVNVISTHPCPDLNPHINAAFINPMFKPTSAVITRPPMKFPGARLAFWNRRKFPPVDITVVNIIKKATQDFVTFKTTGQKPPGSLFTGNGLEMKHDKQPTPPPSPGGSSAKQKHEDDNTDDRDPKRQKKEADKGPGSARNSGGTPSTSKLQSGPPHKKRSE
ncbi:hypothetical protein CC1G_03930 [Coprinopsis cinerea okayama7|uniref:Uncharacterized protein n=1 Tax=Coprinopsis cinerea (strain Okayama-7 / 130 / ATCC MYA-4618 / FGSC 9003) TaxID=240176 RepID=A8N883_COPC7|nr:hypothetical protein CC1G_03930 [Coprinopsis cinerea okayama7\|eukprot:XP_001831039.1 hypothetical protein CC1G_03930 [Coprinopsis cinerea okayama7\